MAIPANAVVDYFGTQLPLDNTSLAVVDGAFSVATDVDAWSNTGNAGAATFVLECQFSVLPTDSSAINLHARKLNIQGTNDSPVPSAANYDGYIGSFVVDGDVAINTAMFLPSKWCPLINSNDAQDYEFYIENQAGQTITAGWVLHILTAAKGPKA